MMGWDWLQDCRASSAWWTGEDKQRLGPVGFLTKRNQKALELKRQLETNIRFSTSGGKKYLNVQIGTSEGAASFWQ